MSPTIPSCRRSTLAAALALVLLLSGCTARQAPPADAAAAQQPGSYAVREEVRLSAEQQREFQRALRYLQAEDYEAGSEVLVALLADPQAQGNSAPYINLAIAYRHLGELERAEQSLEAALALNPGHLAANNEYALVLRRAGRFEEAREVYQRLLAAYPEYLPARRNLGILCDLFLADLECAYEQYSVYQAALPDDPSVTLWLADLRARLGR